MPAKQARYETENKEIINQIKRDLETGIKRAIDDGEYWTQVDVGLGTKQPIRDSITKELQELGYEVEMPEYKDHYGPETYGCLMTIKW